MACIAPVSIETPNIVNLRNPKEASKYMAVPCGSCPTCLKKRSGMWVFRLKQEQKVSTSSYFITMTYDEENLPLGPNDKPTLHYPDLQKFMKRLRKREKTTGIKYYSIGEYGDENSRPHYHSIIYNVRDINNIHLSWPHGILQVDECNVRTMAYVAKYVQKQIKFKDKSDLRVREKALMSKGLGKSYLTPQKKKYLKNHLNPYLTHIGGEKIALPRYYKEKTFSQAEKNVINQKSKEHILAEQKFDSCQHEFEWKREQYRYQAKIATLKRNKL